MKSRGWGKYKNAHSAPSLRNVLGKRAPPGSDLSGAGPERPALKFHDEMIATAKAREQSTPE